MAGSYWMGECTSSYDIIEHVDTLLQSIGWSLLDSETSIYDLNTRTSRCIWRGIGDGNDNVYIQMRCSNENTIELDSMVGYDSKLLFYEQPGSIQSLLYREENIDGSYTNLKLPILTVAGGSEFFCWIFADTYHVVIVTRMTTIYESAYLGLIDPIATEKQYPYPMYIAGNGVQNGGAWPSNNSGSFVFPTGGSGYIRRADGVWRALECAPDYPSWNTTGTVFPYNTGNYKLVDNYKETQTSAQDDLLLFPVLLQTNNPIDILGCLHRCYWISGACDIGTQDTLVLNGETYIVFDTKDYRSANSYFVIKMIASDD